MRQINKVAVLGAGVMGSAIAAHLANAGIETLLLDMPPKELTDDEKSKGLTLESPDVKNRLASTGLEKTLAAKPAAFYLKQYAGLVTPGNFADDMGKIRECDWVVEAIIENLDIKKKVFAELVAPNLGGNTVVSTNTSGLSVNAIAEALPEDVRKRFLVTHFFNPPRYMRLLEIVPCEQTDPQIVTDMARFMSRRLGKGVVFAKDTPNFIGNRIGVYSMYSCVRHMVDMGMTVEEVDAVAGQATAKPKSAAFRTADLVGIDTLAHVGQNTYDALTEDDERDIFKTPSVVKDLVDKNLLGNKTGMGFYKKEKADGESKIYYYDYNDGEYKPTVRPKFPSVQMTKQMDDPIQRLMTVINGKDKASEFAWKQMRDTLIYTAKRIPEIADDVVNIDNAMKWGYNWDAGPFEMLDAIGVARFVERAGADGVAVPEYLKKVERFYKLEDGKRLYYDVASSEYRPIPVEPWELDFEILKKTGGEVEKNANASILDIGDGVFLFEFHSKMNAVGTDMLSMTHKAVKRAETEGVGLVVGNRGQMFSAGANLMLLAVAIAEGEWDDISQVIKAFQRATMALKYAKVPVVAAPFNITVGGGCEFALHADAINAYAETYMGLVEMGVGLLPAGGGTKEMATRAILMARDNKTDVSPFIFKYFENIGLAKVSMSAAELFDLGYMRKGDSITLDHDRLIPDAKQKVLALSVNYRPGIPHEDLPAPGRGVAASLKNRLWNLRMGGFATEYEEVIGGHIAHVITGGDAQPGTPVSEQYLLDLERERFLKLCGNRKTLERIQHMLKKGKPLRN